MCWLDIDLELDGYHSNHNIYNFFWWWQNLYKRMFFMQPTCWELDKSIIDAFGRELLLAWCLALIVVVLYWLLSERRQFWWLNGVNFNKVVFLKVFLLRVYNVEPWNVKGFEVFVDQFLSNTYLLFFSVLQNF